MLVQHFSFPNEEGHNFFIQNGTVPLSVHRLIGDINSYHAVEADACPNCQARRLARVADAFQGVLMCPIVNIVLVHITGKIEDTLVRIFLTKAGSLVNFESICSQN